MSLDPRFVLAYWASDYFVTQEDGTPLANGIVTFYRDSARNELKTIYTLTGVPPYTTDSYIPLPNPLILNSAGNPQDANGNNVNIYFYPFDGTPSESDGNVDLYYVKVTDENGIEQYTRSALPDINDSAGPEVGEEVFNFVPNGQFLAHIDGAANGSTSAGKIQQLITTVAPGGWTFERSTNNSTDIVTFYRYPAPISGAPTGNPRYAFKLDCTSPSSTDAFKDLRLKFQNVNRFSNTSNKITVSFSGQSLVSAFTMKVYFIRNFGTGGSPSPTPSPQFIGEVSLDVFPQTFSLSFLPDSNAPYSIGTNNDDFVQFAFRYPTASPSTSLLTSVAIVPGEIELIQFPETTNTDFITRTLPFSYVPDYDGYDVGLPLRITRSGYEADHSLVGKISPVGYDIANIDTAEVLCDGSGYITSNYTSQGIPYARLQAKLFDTSSNCPYFGTGPLFVSVDICNAVAGRFLITTNQPGTQTNTADSGTGFTFLNLSAGSPTVNGWGVTSYHNWQTSSTLLTAVGNAKGLISNYAADVDTNITITQIRNETNAYQVFTLDTSTANITTSGQYFTFETTPNNAFYIWNQINGVGSDPGAGGTSIMINLPTTNSLEDIAHYYNVTLNGYKSTVVTVTTAPAASTYFSFYANSQQYVVYYIVNNVGVAPTVPGAIFIPVSIPSGATAAQVVAATKLAINSYSFAVPDMRGLTIRGVDTTGIWDVDYLTRMTKTARGTGSLIGSIQLDSILHHEHGTPTLVADVAITTGGILVPTKETFVTRYFTEYHMMTNTPPEEILSADIEDYTIDQGETRGSNMTFNFVIHL